jgi:hypothetical protein
MFTSHNCISARYTISMDYICYCGPSSSVGRATDYGLDGPGIESRWGARFSAPVQTGPGSHPASCKMYRVFSGGKERPVSDAKSSPLLVPWSWKSRAIPLLPYGQYGLYKTSVPVQGCTLPLLKYQVAQWLRYCATNRKFVGSIPHGVSGIFR